MFKYIWDKKFLILILLLAVLLVPKTISVPEQSRTETIVIAVGIDKVEDEYEISLQYVIPHASTSSESLDMISEKDKTVDGAIQKINKELGKVSGFAHCRVLVFNDKAGEENITNFLDDIIRKKTNTNNIVLISTPESAKDVLETSNNLDSNLYTFLNNSAFSNELRGYEDLKSVGDYYDSYFGLSKCLRVNVIDVESEEEKSQGDGSGGGSETSSQNGGSDAGASGGGSEKESKKLKNEGKILIIKDAKNLVTLSKEESENLNWFNKDIKKTDFEIKNFSDENLTNADITFHVFNKSVNLKPSFKNGRPFLDVNINIHLKPTQIISENLSQENYKINHDFLTNNLKNEVVLQIINKMKTAEQNFKLNKYDVIDCEELFYKFCNKEYKNFVKNKLGDRVFIEAVVFNYNVEVIKGE